MDQAFGNNHKKINHELARLIIDNAQEAIVVLQDNMIVFVNESALEIFGHRREEMFSKPFIEFIHPHDQKMVYERYKRRIQGENIKVYPYRILCREIQTKWLETNGLKINWHSRPATLNFITDVTRQISAEHSLKQSERRLKDIIGFLPDAIFAVDSKGSIITWNREIEEMTGMPAANMIGKGNYEYALPFYNERRPMLIDLITRSSAYDKYRKSYSPLSRKGEIFFTKKECVVNNAHHTLWCRASIIHDHRDRVVGAIEVLRDISELERKERELQKSKKDLHVKTQYLKDANAALRTMVRTREEDRRELEMSILDNFTKEIIPYIEELKLVSMDEKQNECLFFLENKLRNITSPFLRHMTLGNYNLTPREMHVANFIRDGKSSKEIAEILKVSTGTINFHRNNIRNKLGLKNNKVGLGASLLSI